MMIEINYHAETLETAICEAIVTYLGYGMPAREIIDQLISRGFIRDPGNNAREVVVQRLADVAERMRRGIPSLDPSAYTAPSGAAAPSTQALPSDVQVTRELRDRNHLAARQTPPAADVVPAYRHTR